MTHAAITSTSGLSPSPSLDSGTGAVGWTLLLWLRAQVTNGTVVLSQLLSCKTRSFFQERLGTKKTQNRQPFFAQRCIVTQSGGRATTLICKAACRAWWTVAFMALSSMCTQTVVVIGGAQVVTSCAGPRTVHSVRINNHQQTLSHSQLQLSLLRDQKTAAGELAR